MANQLRDLAKQALCVMVLDLEYSSELRPTHGHTPLRHQFLWDFVKEALGDEFDDEVQRLMNDAAEGNPPIKTNPWLDREAYKKARRS